jgi:hypothetical protein
MNKTIWDPDARRELCERLDMLTPDAKPKWGRMSARQMLAHLVDALRMATGEIVPTQKNLPIRFSPLKQLIIYGPPFPKNSPTAPELITRQADDWDGECAQLREIMESYAKRPQHKKFPRHPAFGELSRGAWGALGYKHIDHHLRQFGV